MKPRVTHLRAPRAAQSRSDPRATRFALWCSRSSSCEAPKPLPILIACTPNSRSIPSPTTSCSAGFTSSSLTHAAPRPTSSPTSARSTSEGSTPEAPFPRCSSTACRRSTSPRPRPTAASPSPVPPASTLCCSRCSARAESTSVAWPCWFPCSPRRTAMPSSGGRLTSPSARSSSLSPSLRQSRTFLPSCESSQDRRRLRQEPQTLGLRASAGLLRSSREQGYRLAGS